MSADALLLQKILNQIFSFFYLKIVFLIEIQQSNKIYQYQNIKGTQQKLTDTN